MALSWVAHSLPVVRGVWVSLTRQIQTDRLCFPQCLKKFLFFLLNGKEW